MHYIAERRVSVPFADRFAALQDIELLCDMQAQRCHAKTFDRAALQQLFRCRKVVFIGDSVLRYMASHFVTLIDTDTYWSGHRDRHHAAPSNISVDFLWRPYVRHDSGC